MAEAYDHILQAERLGLRVVYRLVESAPEGKLRDLARTQLQDELRHVEFFARVSAGLGGIERPSPSLGRLEEELSGLTDYTSIMTLAQVMENAANALFNGYARQSLQLLRSHVRLPGSSVIETLLGAIARLVGKDEASHVAAGMRVLRAGYAGITARERHVLEGRVQSASALMLSACAEVGRSYQRLGFGERAVQQRIADAQQRYWRHLDIDVQPPAPEGPDHV